ncbi:MAG: DUF3050 domain-containing protein [Alphaproteobacteria bacterium]
MKSWTEVETRETPHVAGAKEMYRLLSTLDNARQRLGTHEVYRCLQTIEDVRIFMEHHVFAVWDFMCLLKTLQQRLTCVSVPWLPKHKPGVRRLINEIVLEEESDECADRGYISHFELYRSAMTEAGADTTCIDAFVRLLEAGASVPEALERAQAPIAARNFVENTWQVIGREPTHAIAAAFTFGREEPIPGMFRAVIERLEGRFPGRMARFTAYLDRHVQLDEAHHAPMAVEMLVELCQHDADKWNEARAAALGSLEARLALWDAVVAETSLNRNHADTRESAPLPSINAPTLVFHR